MATVNTTYFAIEDRFYMDIGQIHEGLTVFVIVPWENGLPEPKYDNGPFFMVKQICGDGIDDRERL